MARADVMQLNGLQKNVTQEWDTFMSWLRSERGVMTQAEVLVPLSIILFAIQIIFGWWRRCCHSSLIKYLLWLAYSTTPSVVIYTLGLMQLSSVNEYMKHEHKNTTSYDPVTLEGYNYLVSWRRVSSEGLRRFPLVGDKITVSDIWLDSGINVQLKELSLSFALFQLLRRRFFGVSCPESKLQKTHDLIFRGLLLNVEENYRTTFRVIEAELVFAHDHMFTSSASFNTRLGKPIIILSIIKSVIYCYAILWSILKHENVSKVFMGLLLALELLQLYVYLSSDWAKLRSICRLECSLEGTCDIGCLFWDRLPQLFGRWQNKIGQLSLLKDLHRQSFTHDMLGTLSWCISAKILQCQESSFSRGISNPGIKGPDHIRLCDNVKLAVAQTLKRNAGKLSNGESSLRRNGQDRLIWACRQKNHANSMLIWHIATEYCEIIHVHQSATAEQISDNDLNLARSLSRYCGYLMAFVPELLPDHHLDTTVCFHGVRKDALEFLQEEISLESKCRKMKNFSWRLPRHQGTFVKGILLGKQLEKIGPARCWTVLVDLWTEMILYIAPSDNARDHIQHLANGGEFLTHLWALLSHAGILTREEHSLDEENTVVQP
ncbi:hypothetical protein BDA96_02G129900 [Sorghum bicolor]|uniref:DUF4220 domain-containing protein n=2 Tax=Sorghum bicolor TaxID=4558 RepID=A0A1B6QAS6_SORBI|nr:uncharacterized protein LOC8057961 isoform X2 [Sorghum bicolor]KAG0542734.1 hypothetical protein BDA96_02G129900 [Sorghum bicolor]KXG35025.1 hypothetical protein SORBI_3002G123600 [Sorghum bicolor]KXG35026.1 hypothetical protein SORBI_3002G123600 [Sorghum bicolor]|eukprot:XP_021308239.1 uncharacterized protein LOC8057961 isoform X2 [Sorghum bicolor]